MLVYRILLTVLSPLLLLAMLRSVLSGRETLHDLAERFGRGVTRSNTRPVLWIHGASNGELTGARRLIETIRARDAALALLVTVNTVSARQMVQDWNIANLETRLAPVDLRWVLNRYLSAFRPVALVSIENEIWPNRFDLCRNRDIAVLVAGARMSERTAMRWDRIAPLLRGTVARTIGAVSYLSAQDAASEQRLVQIGLDAERLLPRMNLKSTVSATTAIKLPDLLTSAFPRNLTWLAASTHEGEEEIVLAAFRLILAEHPTARLILAPRHPARGDAVEAAAKIAGVALARRSRGEAPDAAPVYLADTLGEMGLWFRLSCVTFLGGSLVARGGHTPFEPVGYGSVVLHGPHVDNHAAAFDELAAARACEEVRDAQTLAAAVSGLFNAPEHAAQMAQTARVALEPLIETHADLDAFWTALATSTGISTLDKPAPD
ncbi:3-deoxy-D-manno-octulosonic acid transferase [Celeribacter arenosi]|uniref:3-deoxy-D-manno-octulosonic acid transferase n=1 Tax=Celeribacter arenosi TaxID=792649 RepID=UPI0031D3296F